MTDKTQIFAYLAKIQGMQIAAKEIVVGVDFVYKTLSITTTLITPEGLKRFFFWHEYSEEDNQHEFERLTNTYNTFEHGNSNNSNNS